MHAEAVAQAAEHPHEEDRGGLAHATQVIEVADVEALVEPALDAPRAAVAFEPGLGVETFGREACEQNDLLGLAPGSEAVEFGRLGGEGKAGLLGAHRGFEEISDFVTSLVDLVA